MMILYELLRFGFFHSLSSCCLHLKLEALITSKYTDRTNMYNYIQSQDIIHNLLTNCVVVNITVLISPWFLINS